MRLAAIILSGALAACSDPSARAIDAAQAKVRFLSSDPQSALFEDVRAADHAVCGLVNMKIDGEPTGPTRFLVRGDDVRLIPSDTIRCDLVETFVACTGRPGLEQAVSTCKARVAESNARIAEELRALGLEPSGDMAADASRVAERRVAEAEAAMAEARAALSK